MRVTNKCTKVVANRLSAAFHRLSIKINSRGNTIPNRRPFAIVSTSILCLRNKEKLPLKLKCNSVVCTAPFYAKQIKCQLNVRIEFRKSFINLFRIGINQVCSLTCINAHSKIWLDFLITNVFRHDTGCVFLCGERKSIACKQLYRAQLFKYASNIRWCDTGTSFSRLPFHYVNHRKSQRCKLSNLIALCAMASARMNAKID